MEKVWFVSDTHFSHKNILKFCPSTRQGKDYEDHDEILIRNWQQQVQPQDRVYMLGDIFFCDAVRARSIMRRLPGQKHLVYGNHDKVIQSNKDLRDMFESVADYKELTIDGQHVVLFHFPQMEWNRMHRGAFCLFGHVHGSLDNHSMVTSARTMDVGVDARPNGETHADGSMTLWGWDQVKRVLERRAVRTHHGKAD